MIKKHVEKIKTYLDPNLGFLILRIGLGVAFMFHGWTKLEHISDIAGFFGTLGLPAFVAYFVAGLEFVGGAAMILGVYVGIFGSLLAIDMFFAIVLVAWNMARTRGFGGLELEFLLGMMSLGIALVGSGKYAIMELKK